MVFSNGKLQHICSHNLVRRITKINCQNEIHTTFFMSECKFNESIPAWLGNHAQLIDLDLSINNFGGEMLLSISNLFVLS